MDGGLPTPTSLEWGSRYRDSHGVGVPNTLKSFILRRTSSDHLGGCWTLKMLLISDSSLAEPHPWQWYPSQPFTLGMMPSYP